MWERNCFPDEAVETRFREWLKFGLQHSDMNIGVQSLPPGRLLYWGGQKHAGCTVFSLLCFICSDLDGAQDLAHAMQVLYH
jgi:hypothetical protein